MHSPYSTKIVDGKKVINYNGNNIYSPVENIEDKVFPEAMSVNRVKDISCDKKFFHLHKIDNAIFFATVEYFKKNNTEWCNLPLTTLMISSPGEVYAGQKLNYTTDTLPVELSWFGNGKKVFLSESSQFYLELRLLIDKVDRVFSVYNSFRKEPADYSHLSEFQHVEFEGKVSFEENIKIATGLMKYITNYLINNNKSDLNFFLSDKEIEDLPNSFDEQQFYTLSLKEALGLLFDNTKDEKYHEFSMKNFGAWEEIKLTEILGKHAIVTEFPILEIPFYHNSIKKNEDGISLAHNADIILMGYRETIGGGARISDKDELLKKAKVFNLPAEDYGPYLQSRNIQGYKNTAGFGLGWQRFVHWLLKLPYIWESTHIPRSHYLPKP